VTDGGVGSSALLARLWKWTRIEQRRNQLFDVVREPSNDLSLFLWIILEKDASRTALIDDVETEAGVIGNEIVTLVAPRFADRMNPSIVVDEAELHPVERTGF
jgi:hypothetical protein